MALFQGCNVSSCLVFLPQYKYSQIFGQEICFYDSINHCFVLDPFRFRASLMIVEPTFLPNSVCPKYFLCFSHNNMLKGKGFCWVLAILLSTLVSTERLTFTIVTAVYGRAEEALLGNDALSLQENMIIFGPERLRKAILAKRQSKPTVYVQKDIEGNKAWPFSKEAALSIEKKVEESSPFLLAEAMQHDKFGSRMFVWEDFERLRTNHQEMLKLFFELAQPQWLLFTFQAKQKEGQIGQLSGEQRYIGRKLKASEVADYSMMGGSVDIVIDFKNAYESLLRTLREGADGALQKWALSLIPLRFPSIVPYTTSISLGDNREKINKFNDVSRLHKPPRSFDGRFRADGQLTMKSHNSTFIFQDTFSNYSDKYPFQEPIGDIEEMDERRQDFLAQISASNKTYSSSLFIDFSVLMLLIAASIFLHVRNRSIKSSIKLQKESSIQSRQRVRQMDAAAY